MYPWNFNNSISKQKPEVTAETRKINGDYSSAEGWVDIDQNIKCKFISGKEKKEEDIKLASHQGEISIDKEGKITVRTSQNIRRNYTINYLLRYAHGC